jgi:hypothetical protein
MVETVKPRAGTLGFSTELERAVAQQKTSPGYFVVLVILHTFDGDNGQ